MSWLSLNYDDGNTAVEDAELAGAGAGFDEAALGAGVAALLGDDVLVGAGDSDGAGDGDGLLAGVSTECMCDINQANCVGLANLCRESEWSLEMQQVQGMFSIQWRCQVWA